MVMMERAEREGWARLRASARSSVSGLSPVAAGPRFEAVEAVLAVLLFPAAQGGETYPPPPGAGDVIPSGRNLAAQSLLAARFVFAPQQGQNEGETKEGQGRALVVCVALISHWINLLNCKMASV
jgi:hypothetical protein